MRVEDGQYPDIFFSQLDTLVRELTRMGEAITLARITGVILEGITHDYNLVKFQAQSNPSFDLDQIKQAMATMYVNNNLSGTGREYSGGNRGTALWVSQLSGASNKK